MKKLNDLCIRAFIAADGLKLQARQSMLRAVRSPVVPALFFAMTLVLFPFEPTMAAGLRDLMGNWGETARSAIDFIMIVAVLTGVCAIFYGLKLIWDKSNERENVKTGHIILSLAGGAALCVLWFVVTVMTDTVSDGASGDIGSRASF